MIPNKLPMQCKHAYIKKKKAIEAVRHHLDSEWNKRQSVLNVLQNLENCS